MAKDDDFSQSAFSQYSSSTLGEIIEEENECDKFDNLTYYSVCLSFIGAIFLTALYTKDLALVFGIIAAFSEILLITVFPGLFYLTGLDYIGIHSIFQKVIVSVFIGLGLAYFGISNYFNYWKCFRL